MCVSTFVYIVYESVVCSTSREFATLRTNLDLICQTTITLPFFSAYSFLGAAFLPHFLARFSQTHCLWNSKTLTGSVLAQQLFFSSSAHWVMLLLSSESLQWVSSVSFSSEFLSNELSSKRFQQIPPDSLVNEQGAHNVKLRKFLNIPNDKAITRRERHQTLRWFISQQRISLQTWPFQRELLKLEFG